MEFATNSRLSYWGFDGKDFQVKQLIAIKDQTLEVKWLG